MLDEGEDEDGHKTTTHTHTQQTLQKAEDEAAATQGNSIAEQAGKPHAPVAMPLPPGRRSRGLLKLSNAPPEIGLSSASHSVSHRIVSYRIGLDCFGSLAALVSCFIYFSFLFHILVDDSAVLKCLLIRCAKRMEKRQITEHGSETSQAKYLNTRRSRRSSPESDV